MNPSVERSRNPMKVLFVCYANVGRSQVAQACFDPLSKHDSASAGIAVNERIAAMKLPRGSAISTSHFM